MLAPERVECPACGYDITATRRGSFDPDLAPVIAHLRAEAERKRARMRGVRRLAREGRVPGAEPESPAQIRAVSAYVEIAATLAREASALERAAEILSRHV